MLPFFFFNSSYKLSGKSSLNSTVFFVGGEKRELGDQRKNFFFSLRAVIECISKSNCVCISRQVTLHIVCSIMLMI